MMYSGKILASPEDMSVTSASFRCEERQSATKYKGAEFDLRYHFSKSSDSLCSNNCIFVRKDRDDVRHDSVQFNFI